MLAIVLSGGGAKGAYEVGVWKALKKLKIKYQIVTGTSIGALNGMMMVQKDFYKCLKMWKNINYDMLYDNFDKVGNHKEMYLAYLNKIINGGIETEKIEKIIEDNYRPTKLCKFKTEFGVVAYNITNRKVVYATKKNTSPKRLKKYILASATCFPVLKPTKIGNDILVDGGYYDNLPINLAIDLGATEIIAVDLGAIGFRKKVRNKEIKITYIEPNNKLDSFLMFDSNVTKKMINLGYNDTMKVFSYFEGHFYTFKKGSITNLYYRYKNKISNICNSLDYIGNFKNFDKLKEPIEKFNQIVEDTLDIFKIPIDKVYNSRNINKYLFDELDKVDMIEFSSFELEKIKKIFNSASITKYIYLKIKNCDKINVVFNFFSKEFTAAIYLLSVR